MGNSAVRPARVKNLVKKLGVYNVNWLGLTAFCSGVIGPIVYRVFRLPCLSVLFQFSRKTAPLIKTFPNSGRPKNWRMPLKTPPSGHIDEVDPPAAGSETPTNFDGGSAQPRSIRVLPATTDGTCHPWLAAYPPCRTTLVLARAWKSVIVAWGAWRGTRKRSFAAAAGQRQAGPGPNGRTRSSLPAAGDDPRL